MPQPPTLTGTPYPTSPAFTETPQLLQWRSRSGNRPDATWGDPNTPIYNAAKANGGVQSRTVDKTTNTTRVNYNSGRVSYFNSQGKPITSPSNQQPKQRTASINPKTNPPKPAPAWKQANALSYSQHFQNQQAAQKAAQTPKQEYFTAPDGRRIPVNTLSGGATQYVSKAGEDPFNTNDPNGALATFERQHGGLLKRTYINTPDGGRTRIVPRDGSGPVIFGPNGQTNLPAPRVQGHSAPQKQGAPYTWPGQENAQQTTQRQQNAGSLFPTVPAGTWGNAYDETMDHDFPETMDKAGKGIGRALVAVNPMTHLATAVKKAAKDKGVKLPGWYTRTLDYPEVIDNSVGAFLAGIPTSAVETMHAAGAGLGGALSTDAQMHEAGLAQADRFGRATVGSMIGAPNLDNNDPHAQTGWLVQSAQAIDAARHGDAKGAIASGTNALSAVGQGIVDNPAMAASIIFPFARAGAARIAERASAEVEKSGTSVPGRSNTIVPASEVGTGLPLPSVMQDPRLSHYVTDKGQLIFPDKARPGFDNNGNPISRTNVVQAIDVNGRPLWNISKETSRTLEARSGTAATRSESNAHPTQTSSPYYALAQAASDARIRTNQRMRRMLGQANSGIDPTLLIPQIADYGIIGADYLRRGFVDFGEFSKRMVSDFGIHIKPWMETIYRDSVRQLNSLTEFANRHSSPGSASLKIGPNRHEVVLEDLLNPHGELHRTTPVLGDTTGLSPYGRPDPFGVIRRGGPGYGQIDQNWGHTGWATSTSGKRTAFNNSIVKGEVGFLTKQKDMTSLSNPTYNEAYIHAVREAIRSGALSEHSANMYFVNRVNAIRARAARNAKPDPFNGANIKSFNDIEEWLRNMTFEGRKDLIEGLGQNEDAQKIGLPSHGQVLRQFNDFNHVPEYHVVGAVHFDPHFLKNNDAALKAAHENILGHDDYPFDHFGVHLGYVPNTVPVTDIFGDAVGPRANIHRIRRSIEMSRPDIPLTDDIIKMLGIRSAEESHANPIINGPPPQVKPASFRH